MADIKKIHIKKGDTVKILTGNDNGKTGKVLEVITSKYRAIVEGVNMSLNMLSLQLTNPKVD